jgi:methionyl-tRNA formyltransferase
MTSGGPHAWITINALRERFGEVPVILEEGEAQSALWARRRKMLGLMKVVSMQAARVPIRLTRFGTESRVQELISTLNLKPDMPADLNPIRVPSVNSEATRTALRELQPKAIYVVSTRMLGKKTLGSTSAPFINYHSGVTPAYRGMYGGYFSLANGQPELFGGTVHLVDSGVDTGGILYQSQCEATKRDNFHTYLYVLAAGSRGIVIKAIEDALAGQLKPYDRDLPSQQYFFPTFGQYVVGGLTRGVW